MTDAALAKWLREELPRLDKKLNDYMLTKAERETFNALTALVVLASGLLDCHEAKCDGRPGHTCKYLKQGRAVLGEGR